MLVKDFKDIIRPLGIDGYINFLEYYESTECDKQRFYEVYSCFALEELYPSAKVYDLNYPKRIPSTDVKRHNLSHILQGQSTRGGDILVVDTHFSILFDCKTKENIKKSIDRDSVSGKWSAWKGLNRTAKRKGVPGIEKFGIISDTLTDLTINTKKDMPDASLLNRDNILNEKLYKAIYKKCINEEVISGDEVDYRPNNSWTDTAKEYVKSLGKLVGVTNFVELSIQKLKADVIQYHKDHPDALLKIINLWPAGAGKTTFWILCWIHIFYDKSAKNVLNMVVCHNTTVLNNNIMRLVEHIHTMPANEQPEILVVTDKKMHGSSDAEDYMIRNYTKQMTFGKDFIKYLRQKRNHQVFIFTLIHNYSKLENVLAQENKTVEFTFLDELHHYIQPIVVDDDTGHILENWSAPVENKRGVLKNILGASANKKEIEDLTGYTMPGHKAVDMEVGPLNTWQIAVTHISEIMARDFGWKRQAVLKIKPFSADCFKNKKLIKQLGKGKNPKVKLKGFIEAVPVYWLTNADAWLVWKLENPGKYHTLATCNSLKNCILYAKFLQFYIDEMLMEYVAEMKGINGNSEIVKRIKNLHIEVVETETYNTASYLKSVEAVPLQQGGEFEDSVILHCKLLGEGWSPKGGWVDSTQFIDPAHSKMKIYQFMERASRVTEDANSESNHLIFAHWDGTDNRVHNLFKFVKNVCEELEIAVDPIGEKEVFDVIGSTIGGGGGGKKPKNTVFFVEDANVLQSNFKTFYRDGKYVPNYNIYVEYLEMLEAGYTKYLNDEYAMFNALSPFGDLINRDIKDEIYKKYKPNFATRDRMDILLGLVKNGKYVSSLISKSLDIEEIITASCENLTNVNKPLILSAINNTSDFMIDNILDFVTTKPDTFESFYNKNLWDNLEEIVPISCDITKSMTNPYNIYYKQILKNRLGWYDIEVTVPKKLQECNTSTAKQINDILKNEADSLINTEANFFNWKSLILNTFDTDIPAKKLGQVINRVTDHKGISLYFDKKIMLKNKNKVKQILFKTADEVTEVSEWSKKYSEAILNSTVSNSFATSQFFTKIKRLHRYLDFTDSEIKLLEEKNKEIISKSSSKRVNNNLANGMVSGFAIRNKRIRSGELTPGYKNKGIPVHIKDTLNGVKVNKEFANKHRAAEYLKSIGYVSEKQKKPISHATVERRCKANYPGWTLLYDKRTDSR